MRLYQRKKGQRGTIHDFRGPIIVAITEIEQSMGVDGFNQAHYSQLVLDISRNAPPLRPSLVVSLPIPRNKRPRESTITDSSSETDDSDSSADKVRKSSLRM